MLPESLKYLPLYTLGLLRCKLLSFGSDVRADERVYIQHVIKTLPVDDTLTYLYPRMFRIDDLEMNNVCREYDEYVMTVWCYG